LLVTLTDTGPLVALINRNDPNHAKCVAATKRFPAGALVTTWPCFTEAMYLLFRAGGYAAQKALWQLRAVGRLTLHELNAPEMDRMSELMEKYRDKPMDLADASIVAAAESLGTQRVFALDTDFHVYRLADGSTFQVVP
jgi:predicted nucleic acid-binding protein